MIEPTWTSRDLVVLALIIGAYDDGNGYENLDEVSSGLGFDRGVTGRSARMLYEAVLVNGTEAESIEGSDEDYDLLLPTPTAAGYQAVEEWPTQRLCERSLKTDIDDH